MKNNFKAIYNELDDLEKELLKISRSGKINARDITDMIKTIEFKKAEIHSLRGNLKVMENKLKDIKTFNLLLKG